MMRLSLRGAADLLWRAQEDLRRLGTREAKELADDMFVTQDRLRYGTWTQATLAEWAATFLGTGRRRHAHLALFSRMNGRVYGFIEAVLLRIDL